MTPAAVPPAPSLVDALLEYLVALLTVGRGTLQPGEGGWLGLLTTAARTSYPWPLAWGNALWACAAYSQYRDSVSKKDRPGRLWGAIISFVLYTSELPP